MKPSFLKLAALPIAASAALAMPLLPANAQQSAPPQTAAGDSQIAYADLADLTLAAPLVITADIKKATRIKPERTGPIREGWARLYVEAETKSLLAGTSPVGAKLKYLADVKLDDRGRVPKLKRKSVVLFARPVPGSSSEIQLVAPDAQRLAETIDMVSLRALLTDSLAADAPPVITGVRDALHTPGNLAGEGETQIFLNTKDGSPASIAVVRMPGRQPVWGLSTGELVQIDAQPPRPGTLEWYRLACALPAKLPPSAQLANDPGLQQQAATDYAVVLQQLGACTRNRVF